MLKTMDDIFSTQKIKVAFFADILIEDFDGASRTMFQLIRRIPSARFEFLFVCGLGPEKINGFDCVQVPAMTVPVNTTYKMALPWFLARTIRKKLDDFQPDVIHIATPSPLGEFALKYAGRRHVPVLSIYHTHFISYIEYYLKTSPQVVGMVRSMVEKTLHSFYNRCDRVYVPSEEMRAALLSWKVDPGRLQLWQRGIDTQLFSPAKKDGAMIRQLTGNDRPVILFASRLVWEKNLETLCRIYERIQERNSAFNLLIAGDGVAREECKKRMPGAIFTGKLDQERLSVLYASADVFLFPSVSESYGNVVLEAMASGLPCVIADGGGSRNFIQQGVNGFLCRPNDPEDYLEKISRLLKDNVLHRQFVEAGLQYSRAFSWPELADTYFNDLTQMALNKRLPMPALP